MEQGVGLDLDTVRAWHGTSSRGRLIPRLETITERRSRGTYAIRAAQYRWTQAGCYRTRRDSETSNPASTRPVARVGRGKEMGHVRGFIWANRGGSFVELKAEVVDSQEGVSPERARPDLEETESSVLQHA